MFCIKIKLKGYLKNVNENKTEIIDTSAIKRNNTICYTKDNTKHNIIIENDKIVLSRNNEEYSYELIFQKNKEYISEYYIKKLNTSINIRIITNNLIVDDNKIEIKYKIIDSEEEYIYFIEMNS